MEGRNIANMKKINRMRPLSILIVLLIVMICAMFLPYLLSGESFFYGYDIRHQYLPFYSEYQEKIFHFLEYGKFPYYSWDIFLGNNFWSSKAYYMIGDVFNYIFIFFKELHYVEARFMQTIIKLSIATISFFFLMKKYYKNKLPLIIGAFCYGFSFWMIHFIEQPIFMSVYALAPLYFLAMENYLQEKKTTMYVAMTALIACVNYYLFFTISAFSVVYFTYRYFLLRDKFDFIEFAKDAGILILHYLVGVLMVMVILLPAALYILNNARVGAGSLGLFYDNFMVYLKIIQGYFSPNFMLHFSAEKNVFFITPYSLNEVILWAGSIPALLLPQILMEKDIKFRKATMVLYLFLIFMILFPVGGYIFHGFSDINFRWLFLVIMMNILVSMRYLENPSKINDTLINRIIKVAIGVGVLVIGFILVGPFNQEGNNYTMQIGMMLLFLSFFIVQGHLLKKRIKYWEIAVLSLTLVELLVASQEYRYYPYVKEIYASGYIQRVENSLQTEQKELISFLKYYGEDVDEGYFRIYLPTETVLSGVKNASLFYDINGVTTYDSTISPSIYDLVYFEDSPLQEYEWDIHIENEELINYLSVKYAVVLDEEELPHDRFEYIESYYGLEVYRNLDVVPFGITYSDVVTYAELEAEGKNQLDQLTKTVITRTHEDKEEIMPFLANPYQYELRDISYGTDHLTGNIFSEESSFMVIQLPYDKGWKVHINGEKVKAYQVNGGMMGFIIPEGYSRVELDFRPVGIKTGAIVSGIGIVLFLGIAIKNIYQERRKHEKSDLL